MWKTLRKAGGLTALVLCVTLASMLGGAGCAARGQRYSHFVTPTPLPAEPPPVLVIGFLGGREPWNTEKRNVRRFALKLRTMNLPGVHVETVENSRRYLALELVRNALDRNRDGRLDGDERGSVRIIVYGQSFGGAAVVKLARELAALEVPMQLTVQVDSVGRNDAVIPPNVACAANLYQRNGLFIRGEPEIRAQDPARTAILGNFRYHYSRKAGKKIDISVVPWWKRLARTAHTRMDYDPEVWARVEAMVLHAIRTGGCAGSESGRPLASGGGGRRAGPVRSAGSR